ILSLPERALLTNLLRRAKGHAKPWDDAIAEAIARVVGETIVERACTILGSSVVQRLIEQPSTLTGSLEVHPTWPVGLATPPHPPHNPHPPPPPPRQPPGPASGFGFIHFRGSAHRRILRGRSLQAPTRPRLEGQLQQLTRSRRG